MRGTAILVVALFLTFIVWIISYFRYSPFNNNLMKKHYHSLYASRFEVYLTIQMIILFGSLVIPMVMFENYVTPILFSLNILTGLLILSKKKKAMWFCSLLFLISLSIFGKSMFTRSQVIDDLLLIRLGVYFLINIIITKEIIKQVWQEKEVDRKVILGLISGYISLGFLGYFLFMSIDIIHEGAFIGNSLSSDQFQIQSDSLLYYSFITLMTIGYGEIIPAIPIAQKGAILIGLIGQFYLVIVTAVVIEKYIRHISKQ